MSKQMLTLKEVMDKVKLKKSAVYDLAKNGDPKFPSPVKLGCASRWVESEVDDWLDECAKRYKKAG
ncbi:AlpA family phage regulatory protein [uncultured Marinobacter sp.]|uniref:helix-turn-helix transcriptional regulator n=1 Tax=uncultured Marinobacter sp. TaxID=187379 RepID=UPI0030D78BF0